MIEIYYLLVPISAYFYHKVQLPLYNRILWSCTWKSDSCSVLPDCDPMDCSPPGSSVQGILQARILEWAAIPFSRGSSPASDWTWVSCMQADSLPSEPPGKREALLWSWGVSNSLLVTDAEAEAPVLWLPDAKSWLTGKDPDVRKDWGQENGATDDELAGWHHQLSGHEFEQTPGDSERQGSLECCSSWGCKESETT